MALRTTVPAAATYAWVAELDLSGQLLRDTVSILSKRAERFDVLGYGELRRVLQEEVESRRQRKPSGFVCALWNAWLLRSLPRLVATCDHLIAASGGAERYVSLVGLDRLLRAYAGGPALQPALELTADPEVRRRLKETYRFDRTESREG